MSVLHKWKVSLLIFTNILEALWDLFYVKYMERLFDPCLFMISRSGEIRIVVLTTKSLLIVVVRTSWGSRDCSFVIFIYSASPHSWLRHSPRVVTGSRVTTDVSAGLVDWSKKTWTENKLVRCQDICSKCAICGIVHI